MNVKILKECGYEEALLGLSLSYNRDPEDMVSVSKGLYVKDGGHNGFLESIYIWLDINAPRYWWSEADRYRLTTKQSESTMHTILKTPLTNDNFEGGEILDNYLAYLNQLIRDKEFVKLKRALPESFLQRRVWVMNYKVLRNIMWQRYNHKLEEWQIFCRECYNQVEHKEFLKDIRSMIGV